MTDESTHEPLPETTELERRVLAHERILQSLIAYMAQAEPRFLDHLSKTFVEPMAMARREQDFTDTDDYAEEFVRAVAALGEAYRTRERVSRDRRVSRTGAGATAGLADRRPGDQVRVQERNGVWSVLVDGRFRGDYLTREHAETAAALARLGFG